MNEELKIAISFARLELLELEHGRRTLTQCPGVKAIAAAIREAEKTANAECVCGDLKSEHDPDGTCRARYDDPSHGCSRACKCKEFKAAQ